ncbi:MAG: hypothetical protein FJ255_04735 [Phycisphaerae bacterium]|nr:hypothetical protein [Phycisphaerae bacterium]
MLLFTGQADATIDGKSRLAIPAKYRTLLEQAGEPPTWFCMPWPEGYLRLYPASRFERLADAGPDSLTPDADRASLDVAMFSLFEQLEMDTNGRVIIPRDHLALARLGTDVVVVGARNRLEVRDRGSWEAQRLERFQRLGQLAERFEARRPPGT